MVTNDAGNLRGDAVYTLKVAASRVGLSPRTLRLYEEAGLIEPARVGGNEQRLYSEQDLQWLRCIRDMIHGEKLTVPAIRRLLDLIPCWEVRHCTEEQAAACRPGLNIPGVGREAGARQRAVPARDEGDREGAEVEVVLVYGVKEHGAVLPCSRCVHAERVLRKVAAQHEERVAVRKVDIMSEAADEFGVLLPPAIIVNDEVVCSGQGISEGRLEEAVQRHLE